MSMRRGLSPVVPMADIDLATAAVSRSRSSRVFGAWHWAVLALAVGTSDIANADYGAALEAFRLGKYDVMTAEIRSADPTKEKEGLRALVRAMDGASSAKPPQRRILPSDIPNIYEVGALLEEAADLVRDGEAIYRLQYFVKRPPSNPPNRRIVLRFKKAAEYGYALAQYQYGYFVPRATRKVESGLEDLAISEREALAWIRQAAEGGEIMAQTWMATMGRPGDIYDGMVRDPVLLQELKSAWSWAYWREWMEKAATNEQFESGLSTPSSLAEARADLASAYSLGPPRAPLDYAKAYRLATLSAATGNQTARNVLARLQWAGYPPNPDAVDRRLPPDQLGH